MRRRSCGPHRSLVPRQRLRFLHLLGAGVAGKSFKGCAQGRVTDAFGGGLDGLSGIHRQVMGVPADFGLHGRRLYFEQNPGQAGELVKGLQLTLQAFLLVAQTRGPMAIGDD